MPGSPLQFLSVGFSEHDPDTIKDRREENNSCISDDVLEGRQYVTTALMSFADLKHMPGQFSLGQAESQSTGTLALHLAQ